MAVVTNKKSGLLWQRGGIRKNKGGSGEGFRYLMFFLYKGILKYVQIYTYSKIHQVCFKRQSIWLMAM